MMPMARELDVLEHGETSGARMLRRHRLRIALVVAVVEGILVIADVIPWWLVVSLALVGLVVYTAVGRNSTRADLRSVTWIAAVSQLIVVLVPIAAVVVGILAIVVVALLAVVALVALLADRR
jgi:hypothetical protein